MTPDNILCMRHCACEQCALVDLLLQLPPSPGHGPKCQQHLLGDCSLVTEDVKLMVALVFEGGVAPHKPHHLLLTLEPELSKAKTVMPQHAE